MYTWLSWCQYVVTELTFRTVYSLHIQGKKLLILPAGDFLSVWYGLMFTTLQYLERFAGEYEDAWSMERGAFDVLSP